MHNQSFIPYQRLELKSMGTEKIISIIFILCFLMKGRDGLVDVGNFTPDPTMTHGINWLSYHQYRHLEYSQGVRDFIRTSNGRTFQNRKLTFPHGSLVYSQEIKDVFSVNASI